MKEKILNRGPYKIVEEKGIVRLLLNNMSKTYRVVGIFRTTKDAINTYNEIKENANVIDGISKFFLKKE